MGDIVQRNAVEEEEIVVAVSSVHVQAAHEFVACRHARECLQLFYDVGRTEEGYSAAEFLSVDMHQAGLGGVAHLFLDRSHAGAVKRVAALHHLCADACGRQ